MKTTVIFLAGMMIAAIATAQDKKLKEIEVTPPAFKGEVSNSITGYLQKAVVYPSGELKWSIQGTVVVGFLVSPEGEVKDIEVINSLSPGTDREVIRVLKSTSGKWVPGFVNQESAAMENEVSVAFKLYPQDDFNTLAAAQFKKGTQEFFIKKEPQKALKYFNKAIIYRPNDETLMAMRGLCKYKLGDEAGAECDWARSKILAERNGTLSYIELLAKVPDDSQEYQEMIRAVSEQRNATSLMQ